MKCNKCGKSYNVNLSSCPFCGYKDNNVVTSNDSNVKDDSSSFGFLLPLIIIVIIGSLGYLTYNYFQEKNDEKEFDAYMADRTLEYKSKGYTFMDLNTEDTLDKFVLVNEDYKYIDKSKIDGSTSFCSIFNDATMEVSNGYLIITDSSSAYSNTLGGINNIRFVTSYTKSGCECNDFNIVLLTTDGKVLIFESDGLNYESISDLVSAMSNGFKELRTEKAINSIAITSYVGDVNPCGEKVLLMLDEDNNDLIYRNGEISSSEANYSSIIYNIKDDISIYINADRSLNFGKTYNPNGELIKENGIVVKYTGAFKERNSNDIYILSKDMILYKLNFNNGYIINIDGTFISDIGYKFDYHNNTTSYIFLYTDGTYKEYVGDFETHGLFSMK